VAGGRDQELPEGTLTRTEVLTARGYPPEIVNGNGHVVQAVQLHEPDDPGGGFGWSDTCPICRNPRASRMATCGGDNCVSEHRKQQNRENERHRRERLATQPRSEPSAAAIAMSAVGRLLDGMDDVELHRLAGLSFTVSANGCLNVVYEPGRMST
jgi:hypothetical protein